MQNTANSIVFLDFAGVLHPSNKDTFEHRPAFQDFLRQHPTVLVVFSTPLRTTHSLEQLRLLFSDDLAPRFIDVTPVLPAGRTSAPRETEIRTWMLANNAYGRHWAALDADSALYAPSCGELVRCPPNKGMGAEQFDDLRQILRFSPPRVSGPHRP